MQAVRSTCIALISFMSLPAFAAPSVSLTAKLERSVCLEGRPVVLSLALRNDGAQKLRIGDDVSEASSFQILVTGGAGRMVPRTAVGDRIRTPPAVAGGVVWEIEPGQTFRYRFNLARLFDLSRAGVYAVRVSRRLQPSGGLPSPGVALRSGPLQVRMAEDAAARSGPTALTPPSSRHTFLYAANADYSDHSFVSRFRVAESGAVSFAFSPPPQAPVAAVGEGVDSLVTTPDGRFLYVANGGDDTVSQFRIGAEGELMPLSPPTVPARKFPGFLLMDPRGRFLYALSGYGNTLCAIGPDGRLTVRSTVTSKTWVQNQDHNVVPARSGAINPLGTALYACADFADVSSPGPYDRQGMTVAYRLAPDGTVTALVPSSKYLAERKGLAPDPEGMEKRFGHHKAVAFSPSGRFAFVLAVKAPVELYDGGRHDPASVVVPMRVGADGSLTLLPEVPTPRILSGFGQEETTLVVDPTGRFLLLRVDPEDLPPYSSGIARYRIGPGGSLTLLGVTLHDGLMMGMAFGPVGHLVYVLGRTPGPGSLTAFRLDDQGGLTPAGLDMPKYEVPGFAVGPALVVAPTPQRWGPRMGGLQISARMAADTLPTDAPAVLTVVLKNVTSRSIRLGAAGTDLSSFRLSLAGPQRQTPDVSGPNPPSRPGWYEPDGEPARGDPAVAAVPLLAAGRDVLDAPGPSAAPLVLPPGGQRQYRFVLSRLADLTLIGNYTVSITRALAGGLKAAAPLVHFKLEGPYDHLGRGGPERHLEVF